MQPSRTVPFVLALLAAIVVRGNEPQLAPKVVGLERVPEIVKIEYTLQASDPPNLVVKATGQVPTGGWTQIQLLRREYVVEPADGIWEYDLLAKRPDGPVTQVITPVTGTDTWMKVNAGKLKGLRVYGVGSGVKEIKLDAAPRK